MARDMRPGPAQGGPGFPLFPSDDRFQSKQGIKLRQKFQIHFLLLFALAGLEFLTYFFLDRA
jgi:hypothetical protein